MCERHHNVLGKRDIESEKKLVTRDQTFERVYTLTTFNTLSKNDFLMGTGGLLGRN